MIPHRRENYSRTQKRLKRYKREDNLKVDETYKGHSLSTQKLKQNEVSTNVYFSINIINTNFKTLALSVLSFVCFVCLRL